MHKMGSYNNVHSKQISLVQWTYILLCNHMGSYEAMQVHMNSLRESIVGKGGKAS